jgi:hypothetical protein
MAVKLGFQKKEVTGGWKKLHIEDIRSDAFTADKVDKIFIICTLRQLLQG